MKGNAEFFEQEEPESGWKPKKSCIIICAVVVVITLIVIGLGFALAAQGGDSSQAVVTFHEARRIDCYPEASSPQEEVDKAKCESRGCEYSPSVNPAVPACYWPKDGPNTGLKVLAEESLVDGKKWILAVKSGSKPFNSDINVLNFTVQELSNSMIRFKVRSV